ncbi:MAG: hypothetical protein ACJ8OJ_11415 [Povalibacter sp.]
MILASLLLALGLFVLPAVIFWIGASMLGPYGTGQSGNLGTFYGDFFGDMASGSVRTWCLALGPLVVVSLVRLIFLRRPEEPTETSEASPPRTVTPKSSAGRRVEPRISLD